MLDPYLITAAVAIMPAIGVFHEDEPVLDCRTDRNFRPPNVAESGHQLGSARMREMISLTTVFPC